MLQSKTLFTALAALVALGTVSTVPAYADVTTGFEPPAYTIGPLSGQNGWLTFGPSVVTVENNLVFAGQQAVFVDGGRTATGQSGPYISTTAGPLVDFSAEIFLASSSSQTAWQFAATGPGLLGFSGGINIDTVGGIQAITSGFPTIGTFLRNQWNQVDIDLNYTTQTFGVVLNGTTLASGLSFCGNNHGPCTGAHVSNTNADYFFDTFGNSDPLAPSNDSGFLDNFSVTTTPEPSFYAALACGLAGIVIGRRKSFRRAK